MNNFKDNIDVALGNARSALQVCPESIVTSRKIKASLEAAILALEKARKDSRVLDMHSPVKVIREDGAALATEVIALHVTGFSFFFRVQGLTAWFRAEDENATWFWND